MTDCLTPTWSGPTKPMFRRIPILRQGHLLAAGVLIAATSVALAGTWVGPIVRSVFGAPRDYGSDYISPEALLQALAVVTATMTVICAACGWLSAQARKAVTWREGVWMLNPLTIAAAFAFLMRVVDGTSIALDQLGGEYLSPAMLGVQALLGSPIYVASLRLGVLLHPRAGRGVCPSRL